MRWAAASAMPQPVDSATSTTFSAAWPRAIDQNFGPIDDRGYTKLIEDGKSGLGYSGTIRGQFILDLGARPVDGGHSRAQVLAA